MTMLIVYVVVGAVFLLVSLVRAVRTGAVTALDVLEAALEIPFWLPMLVITLYVDHHRRIDELKRVVLWRRKP